MTISKRICISGQVQGVGFRPFIYRLAQEFQIVGSVCNDRQGVLINLSAPKDVIDQFIQRIQFEKPINAVIDDIRVENICHSEQAKRIEESHVDQKDSSVNFEEGKFQIISSSQQTNILEAQIPPDLTTCPDCLKEVFNLDNLRYLYPFTNCIHCGPRYSILESLPYDRQTISMKEFDLCDDCRREYEDVNDRRFHAQPNACPKCGPHVELWDSQGTILSKRFESLDQTIQYLRGGKIVAFKGLGGFQLMVDATNEAAVQELRKRKHRPYKPFAVMMTNMDMVRQYCAVTSLEEQWLLSSAAPIVLLKKKINNFEWVAPSNPYLGVMLPNTPLHHIVMKPLHYPIVATSGNLSNEPICIDNKEAIKCLGNIADIFLVHNRRIVRQVDDSVMCVVDEKPLLIRRSRGFAPIPISIERKETTVLALGSYLKNTVTLLAQDKAYVSQHIGNLDSIESNQCFEQTIQKLREVYDHSISCVAVDAHPDYFSTKYAEKLDLPIINVQHHHAHIVSCMAEHGLSGEVLGISWDGTGYGDDGTIWGGEFLRCNLSEYERVAHLRSFRLPSGDKAVKEPARVLEGLLFELGDRVPSRARNEVIRQMLEKNINCPKTSSMGRLYDAVATLLGLCDEVTFEGQAAMQVQFAAMKYQDLVEGYQFDFEQGVLNWQPMIEKMMADLDGGIDISIIAKRFHVTLVEMILTVAKEVKIQTIVLSGGCFQNQLLLSMSREKLQKSGFDVYSHQMIPPNDGGLSLGQALIAQNQLLIKGA